MKMLQKCIKSCRIKNKYDANMILKLFITFILANAYKNESFTGN